MPTVATVDPSLIADATSRRSEIRVLEAAIQEAQAQEQFGRSFGRVHSASAHAISAKSATTSFWVASR